MTTGEPPLDEEKEHPYHDHVMSLVGALKEDEDLILTDREWKALVMERDDIDNERKLDIIEKKSYGQFSGHKIIMDSIAEPETLTGPGQRKAKKAADREIPDPIVDGPVWQVFVYKNGQKIFEQGFDELDLSKLVLTVNQPSVLKVFEQGAGQAIEQVEAALADKSSPKPRKSVP